jgi:hypothetical protein
MKTLLKTLIERQLIPDNSVFGGRVRARCLGAQTLKVRKDVFYTKLNSRGFVCKDELSHPYFMEFDDLDTIDGMDIERFAKVYNIKADGSVKKPGKKRGRKPKAV